jgi:hypothetical protein
MPSSPASSQDSLERFVASTSGADVGVDDEDLDEYEAAQQEKYDHEKDRLAAMGL